VKGFPGRKLKTTSKERISHLPSPDLPEHYFLTACLREDIKDLVMAMKAVSLMHFIQRHGGGNFLSKEKKEKQFQA
jgi:hypothetical protein